MQIIIDIVINSFSPNGGLRRERNGLVFNYNKSIYEFNDWGLSLAETVFDTPNVPTKKTIIEIVRYKK